MGNSALPDPKLPWFTGHVRRLLPIALATAVLVAAFAGVASARLAGDADAGPAPAPFDAPEALPTQDATHPGSYGFRTSEQLAAPFEQAGPASSTGGTGASATVTVTAVVLPVVFIVVDEAGAVTRIVTNSDDRDARGVLYLPRIGSEDGEPVELDEATWAEARAALADAHEGTGTVWSA